MGKRGLLWEGHMNFEKFALFLCFKIVQYVLASTRRHRVVGQVQVRTLFLFRVLGELKMNTSEQHEETW